MHSGAERGVGSQVIGLDFTPINFTIEEEINSIIELNLTQKLH